MAIRRVREIGDPILRSRAVEAPVDLIGSVEFEHLIADMVETMRDYNGVGIAAPQIGESWRVFAMEVRDESRYSDVPRMDLTVVINPVLQYATGEADGWEGCLSIEGLRGRVIRSNAIEVVGLNQFGDPWAETLEGFHARIFQHELDHLEGFLYVDRMETMKTLTTDRMRDRVNHHEQ